MIILLTKFRVTKISVSYITGENHIGSSFIRQKYFCLPTEIAVLPKLGIEFLGGVTPPPHTHTPVAPALNKTENIYSPSNSQYSLGNLLTFWQS
jgi:hypothetical protein